MRSLRLLCTALALLSAPLAAPSAHAGSFTAGGSVGVATTGSGKSNAALSGVVGYETGLAADGAVYGGVDQSITVQTAGGDARWGTSARLGVAIPVVGSLYAVSGYHYGKGPNATSLGAGYERGFGPTFGRAEYRRYFNEGGIRSTDNFAVTFGFRF